VGIGTGSKWRPGRLLGALAGTGALVLAGAAAAPAQVDDPVAEFQGSWVDRALDLQYDLGVDVPLRNVPIVGTHNSFNSPAEMGTALSPMDSNQRMDIVDQLDVDVRSIELDLHRFPSAEGGGYRPVVCHALAGGAGCSVEKELGTVLAEISGWLREPENSDQVILLYLEDDLDTEGTHDDAADQIDEQIGDLVYAPKGRGCKEVDYGLTRDRVLAAGKQVVIVSGCGQGEAWQSQAFSWDDHLESRPFGYRDFPDCGPDYSRGQYRAHLVRFYEDSTRITRETGGADDGIDPLTAAAMARCGVDLIGLDLLEPSDGRLRSLVWSWAPGEPSGGGCAVSRLGSRSGVEGGRWVSLRCGFLRRRVACRKGNKWKVSRRAAGPKGARRACRRIDARFAVPKDGYDNQLLRKAMLRRGTSSVLLGIHARKGSWVPVGAPAAERRSG
jgi:hypothetical protein